MFFVIFVEIVSFAILWASLSVCILVNRNLLWSLHSTLPAHHHSFICSPCFFSVISGFNICFSISRFLRNHEFPFLVLLPLMYLYYLGLWFSWDYYVKGRLPGLFFFFFGWIIPLTMVQWYIYTTGTLFFYGIFSDNFGFACTSSSFGSASKLPICFQKLLEVQNIVVLAKCVSLQHKKAMMSHIWIFLKIPMNMHSMPFWYLETDTQ